MQLFEQWKNDEPASRKVLFVCMALLFVYSVMIYSKSLQNDFVWDSIGVILEDPMIRDTGNIPMFFAKPLVLGETKELGDGLTTSAIRYYRPLLSVLHTLEYALFGKSPVGYKALNLILNGLVIVLGFLVVRKITASLPIAFLTSLIYASTVARAEAVYWVYSDSHILSALFSLAAFWAYLSGRRWVALFLMATGLLFQESGIVFPVLLIAYEATRNSRELFRKRLTRLAPFALVSLFYLIGRNMIAGQVPSSTLDIASLLKAIGYQCWEHSRIFLSPDGPATVYLYKEGMFSSGGSGATLGAFALIFFVVVAIALWRYRKEDSFWYFWFLTWIMVSFNIGTYGSYLMAEKTLYLAALGLSVLLVRLLLAFSRYQPVALLVICALFLFNSTLIYARASSWLNTSTYLEKVLEFEPEFDLALLYSAKRAHTAGQFEVASQYYLRFLHVRPDLVDSIGKDYVGSVLGMAEELTVNGDYGRAIMILDEASAIIKNNSELHNGLGIVHYFSGNLFKAEKNWMLALKFDPNNTEARNNLKLLSTPHNPVINDGHD